MSEKQENFVYESQHYADLAGRTVIRRTPVINLATGKKMDMLPVDFPAFVGQAEAAAKMPNGRTMAMPITFPIIGANNLKEAFSFFDKQGQEFAKKLEEQAKEQQAKPKIITPTMVPPKDLRNRK